MRLLFFIAALVSFSTPATVWADDDRRQERPASVSQERAIQIARGYGMVRVTEVDRDDDGWEIEGRDHRGRELEVKIDRRGRVISVERDD